MFNAIGVTHGKDNFAPQEYNGLMCHGRTIGSGSRSDKHIIYGVWDCSILLFYI